MNQKHEEMKLEALEAIKETLESGYVEGKDMKYKKADGQGAYIDSLRKQYPFRICRESEPQYEAVLRGIQPLSDGQSAPIYRFPGGECVIDLADNGIKIIEW